MGEIIGSPTRFIQGKYIRTFMEIYRNKRQSLFFLVIVFENERVESAINKSKKGHDSTIRYEIFHGECFNDCFDGCFL